MNIPLPEGVWTVVRGDEWQTNNGKKMREIFLISTEDISGSDGIKKYLKYFIYVNTPIDYTSTRWNDEPCKAQDFIYSNKYNSNLWDQRCSSIRQSAFLTRSDNKVQQIARDYLKSNNIKYVTGMLTSRNDMYDRSGKFLQVFFSVYPTNYGFEKPDDSVDSPWHLSSYKDDPDKVLFINHLKVWAEAYSDIIYNNFQNNKPYAGKIPEFVFVPANPVNLISN